MTRARLGIVIGIVVGIVVVTGVAALAWAAIRPGPMAFAVGQRERLAKYQGTPSGVPADFLAKEPLARGQYLAQAADCEACHTAEGGKPFAGGRPFDTQFGTLYSPNITPDAETGIGAWSDADFQKALYKGVGLGGKRLYPAFPYAAYSYLTEADVAAIRTYLRSLTPVNQSAPANTLKFPYDQRWLMAIWAALYVPDTRFQPVAERSATWNRGAYLAEALGHCGDCHTPRTPLQSLDNRHKFAGGSAEGWRAYNLSSDMNSGIGQWSAADLKQYLRTGHSMDRGSAFGPMALAVHLSLQKLTASDISALVEYVRSVPPVSTPDLPAPKLTRAPENPLDGVTAQTNARGEALFAGNCSGCHSWTGMNGHVPHTTLTGTRAVNDATATNVVLAVLRGASALPASGDIATMPAFGLGWSDYDVAAISNYVIARFGANPSAVTTADVHRLREAR
jgi:mono/diheme cytochrome c family protein